MNRKPLLVFFSLMSIAIIFFAATRSRYRIVDLPKMLREKGLQNEVANQPTSDEVSTAQSGLIKTKFVNSDTVNRDKYKALVKIGDENFSNETIQHLNMEDFKAIITKTDEELPKIKDIQKLSDEELHHTPGLLIEAGRALGNIKQILSQRDDLVDEGLKFYDRCARSRELSTPVRSLCLTNFINYKKEKGENYNLSGINSDVIRLTKEVIAL